MTLLTYVVPILWLQLPLQMIPTESALNYIDVSFSPGTKLPISTSEFSAIFHSTGQLLYYHAFGHLNVSQGTCECRCRVKLPL